MTDQLDRLLQIMAKLRDPKGGCPWDLEQTFKTIAPYTIEEAYEVADAIERGDVGDLKDELGDLLLQVVFHAQMAREAGQFDFGEVASGIADKMVRRHPHVFADAKVAGAEAQTASWEAQKAEERTAKGKDKDADMSALAGVGLAMPALVRADKLQRRAGRVGFDWPEANQVVDKIEEEIAELRAELPEGDPDRLEDEIGDLLFAVVNLARHLQVDSEAALRRCNGKFERRFRSIEARLAASKRSPKEASLAEMEALWEAVKRDERRANRNA
ncbi:MAG: nucleoside triphosphate pyrophosphohydrolase [Proteobacteria bacterium]|nr:nucleoside triphosphate pyrophosphohydrolase [Pseudomonadota bacterium]MBI3496074.1 nucleoside triphosphate pyrophosphohydrolase [Pseudomonadota bacterium]